VKLNSQVLRTVAGHRLRVCLIEDLRIGPISFQNIKLRPCGHEDNFDGIAVWVEN
jgi:hypothetical protein